MLSKNVNCFRGVCQARVCTLEIFTCFFLLYVHKSFGIPRVFSYIDTSIVSFCCIPRFNIKKSKPDLSRTWNCLSDWKRMRTGRDTRKVVSVTITLRKFLKLC